MKIFLPLVSLLLLGACSPPADNTKVLQQRIDSLQIQLANTYKPGFGEFMSSIQAHHSKLWFAGQNQNWKLADFEVHEMLEAVENIQKFETERKESQKVGEIVPVLDSLSATITQHDPAGFNRQFTRLTNTCNSCHTATAFEFNVVKTPEASPFTNQDFRVKGNLK